MTASHKRNKALAFMLPLLVFGTSAFLGFGTPPSDAPFLSTAILLDLTVTAPLLYFVFIRKTGIPKGTTFRIFFAGLLLSSFLPRVGESFLYQFIKTWLAPLIELAVVITVGRSMYKGTVALKKEGGSPDMLEQARRALGAVFGNGMAARLVASELSVFYYSFARRNIQVDNKKTFSTYRNSGVIPVLGAFLFIFIVETAGVHFLLQLWSETGAWILTGLSLYSCLQLFAHIRAVRLRPVEIRNHSLFIRNGILGGEAELPLEKIKRMEQTKKQVQGPGVVKLALLRAFENHSLAVHLSEPVTVYKAFGIRRHATVVLICVDEAAALIQAIAEEQGERIHEA